MNRSRRRGWVLALLCPLAAAAWAQPPPTPAPEAAADTSGTAALPAETLPAETLPAGALSDPELIEALRLLDAPTKRGDEGFDYEADSFVDYVEGDSILLVGHVVVLHRGARLEAAEMVYYRDRRLLVARAGSDTTAGRPTLSRGEDVLEGDRIVYATDTGEGVIQHGRIGHDDGYYAGQRIRTLSEEEFLVRRGSYTTCDYEQPHFDFYSPRIKVIVGDMAIARPVYFRIAEHRLFWVPFYVFSLREDRQSGLLTPGYGRRPISYGSPVSEWEVRDLGYYFAPSDHWDLTVAADWRQRTGWLARGALAYAWRYRFDGNLETRLQSYEAGDRTSWSWWLSGTHNHELSPSSSVRASGTFQSDRDFLRDNGTGLNDRLNRTLRSNLRYDKRWREAGWSLSAGASQTKNLDTERADAVLPEFSLRSNRKALFPVDGDGKQGPWYSRIYWDGSTRLRNTRQTTTDTTIDRTSADASARLSTQGRPADWLNLNTSWNSAWRHADLRDGAVQGVRTDRASATATVSQTFYGLFHPGVGRVTALRHVLKPDVGLSFSASRPDTGDVAGFGGPAGDWDASRRLTFRLANTFWVKLLDAGSGEEAKHRLAQLNLSTAYDLDARRSTATGRRTPLSDLVTSLTLDAGRRLDTRLSLRSAFYDDDDRRLALPRTDRVEVNTTLRLRAARPDAAGRAGADSTGVDSGDDFGYESGLQQDIDRGGRGRRLQLSHYVSWQRGASATRSWLRASAGGSLRRRWHVDYSLSYNLGEQTGVAFLARDRITAELLSIQREFHDWSATVNIEPTDFAENRAFYFKVQFKDIPQIRFERGDRRRVG